MFCSFNVEAQNIKEVFGKDFNYVTLKPIDTFLIVNAKRPSYFVKCIYDNNSLKFLQILYIDKKGRNRVLSSAKVEIGENFSLFIYGSGKMVRNYSQPLQKKIKYSDTAIVYKDTVIFKKVTPGGFQIHLISNLSSNVVNVCWKVLKYQDLEISYSKILQPSYITKFSDSLITNLYTKIYLLSYTSYLKTQGLTCKKIKDFDNKDNCLTFSLIGYPPDIPFSIFWLKHLGFIY